MSINQHFPQNLSKIRENITPEYEANIILLENERKKYHESEAPFLFPRRGKVLFIFSKNVQSRVG